MSTLCDSYAETNQDVFLPIADTHPSDSTNTSAVSQSFTGNGEPAESCSFYLKRVGSPGNLIARIYAHSGTFGTSSLPTGAALDSSSTVAASTISAAAYELISFTGFAGYSLVNGTKYCVVVECYDGTWDGSNCVYVGDDGSSPTHAGNIGYYQNSVWTAASTHDTCFYVYTTGAVNAEVIVPASVDIDFVVVVPTLLSDNYIVVPLVDMDFAPIVPSVNVHVVVVVPYLDLDFAVYVPTLSGGVVITSPSVNFDFSPIAPVVEISSELDIPCASFIFKIIDELAKVQTVNKTSRDRTRLRSGGAQNKIARG